jgi:hypothetical protein
MILLGWERERQKKPIKVKPLWKMPSPGTQKINVDASFIETEGAGATGLCGL